MLGGVIPAAHTGEELAQALMGEEGKSGCGDNRLYFLNLASNGKKLFMS